MKTFYLLAFLLACQPSKTTQKSVLNQSNNPSIRAANRLGMDEKLSQKAFLFYKGSYSGILLAIPNGMVANNTEDSTYVTSCYMDAALVCNLHYLSLIHI